MAQKLSFSPGMGTMRSAGTFSLSQILRASSSTPRVVPEPEGVALKRAPTSAPTTGPTSATRFGASAPEDDGGAGISAPPKTVTYSLSFGMANQSGEVSSSQAYGIASSLK